MTTPADTVTDPSRDSADDPTAIRCQDVVREFTRGSSGWFQRTDAAPTVRALDGVSLAVERGEFVGIAGPSGSGKSTLLHLLAALDTPTSGTVTVAGRETTTLSEAARTRLRRDHVGVVFQRFHLLPSLTARSNVALPLIEAGVGTHARRERADDLLDRVGLADRADHRPGELSGGEQQRVAVARALVGEPSLLIADEPTGELDTETGASVLDLLASVADDRAVVMATHDERALARTDRIIRLRDGRITDA